MLSKPLPTHIHPFQAMHQGVGLSTDTDSELIAQMVAKAVALNYKCRNGDHENYGDISKVRHQLFLIWTLWYLTISWSWLKLFRKELLKQYFQELAVTVSAINMSYALLVMTHDRIYATRDPFGNRPLCVGTLHDNIGLSQTICSCSNVVSVASSCTFDD